MIINNIAATNKHNIKSGAQVAHFADELHAGNLNYIFTYAYIYT